MKRALITCILIILVLFPSPFIIVKDYQRIQEPPIEPQSIENVSDIPDEPQKIERWVEKKIEYRYDFEVYGTVWYVPSPDEVLRKGEGDCKARAILLASIFEKKGIDYELQMSSFHWWVSYENNSRTWAEDRSISVKTGDSWRIPDPIKTVNKISAVRSDLYEMIWGSMPDFRQLFLLSCLVYLWVPGSFYDNGLKSLLKLKKILIRKVTAAKKL